MAALPKSITILVEPKLVWTHQSPAEGSNVMPCCGRTPFDVPRTDRMTLDPTLVTCSRTPGDYR